MALVWNLYLNDDYWFYLLWKISKKMSWLWYKNWAGEIMSVIRALGYNWEYFLTLNNSFHWNQIDWSTGVDNVQLKISMEFYVFFVNNNFIFTWNGWQILIFRLFLHFVNKKILILSSLGEAFCPTGVIPVLFKIFTWLWGEDLLNAFGGK